jgi:hypothetical protein
MGEVGQGGGIEVKSEYLNFTKLSAVTESFDFVKWKIKGRFVKRPGVFRRSGIY